MGLDTRAKLLPANGVEKVQIRKLDGIVLLGFGNKRLPLGSNVIDGGDHERLGRKSVLCLGGPAGVKTAFLGIII